MSKNKASRVLTRFAELMSLITAGSFLVSAIIFHFVFASYGISFFEIASIDDVVREGLAGLMTFFDALLAFLLVAGMLLAADALVRPKVRAKIDSFGWAAAIFAPVVILAGAASGAALRDNLTARMFERGWVVVNSVVLLLVIYHMLTSLRHRLRRRKLPPKKMQRVLRYRVRLRLVRAFRRAMMLGLLFATLGGGTITFLKVRAMLDGGKGDILKADGIDPSPAGPVAKPPACEQPRLMWAGSSNAVIRCKNNYLILRNYQSMVITRKR